MSLGDLKRRVRVGLDVLRPSRFPLHGDSRFSPFFIVGSGRAGTTLLRRVLQGNEQVHIPPEIWSFRKTYKRFLQYRSVLSWTDLAAILTRVYIADSDFDDAFKAETFSIMEQLGALPEKSRSLASLIDAISRAHGRHSGASFTRWGDKTPLNSFCLEEIVEVFPDARFIHLIRDPADVIRSYLKYDMVPDLEAGASRWSRAVQSVREFKSKHESSGGDAYDERVLEVYYEDFVSSPESVIRSICAFLDLNFETMRVGQTDHVDEIDEIAGREHHANVFQPISTEHIGKGRRELDDSALKELDALIGSECEALGYEPLA